MLFWACVYILCMAYIGFALGEAEWFDRFLHEIDFRFKILGAYLMWAASLGTESYTVTSIYKGKERSIDIGGW